MVLIEFEKPCDRLHKRFMLKVAQLFGIRNFIELSRFELCFSLFDLVQLGTISVIVMQFL